MLAKTRGWNSKAVRALFLSAGFCVACAPSWSYELIDGVAVAGVIAPGSYTIGDFISVPAGAQGLTVTVDGQGNSDSVDLYVKFGRAVEGESVLALNEDADYLSITSSDIETIVIDDSSKPGLRPGDWYVSVLNLTDQETEFVVIVTLHGDVGAKNLVVKRHLPVSIESGRTASLAPYPDAAAPALALTAAPAAAALSSVAAGSDVIPRRSEPYLGKTP